MKKVSLELGSGGRLMRDFIAGTILPSFGNPVLDELSDASHLPGGIAFTTDSYVVDPLFFPGGDIGHLAVNGTVNDLVVSGAEPRFLSLAFILEEGLDLDVLERVIRSIRTAARAANVRVVTGDTKVVRRGQGDKIYINTAGIGRTIARPEVRKIRPGDKVILTGTLGDHSLAVMLARGEFGLSSSVRSDCAPLLFLLPLWKKSALWMRDVTRGGLATVLFELAERLRYPILIEEDKVPLSRPVRAASELLGIDPLYMACEGKAVIIVPKAKAGEFLRLIRRHPLGRKAAVIGEIQSRVGRPGELLLQTATGGLRLLEPLTSELLPRIC
ncbi:MAG: hydrogenase expression/formation protein HypE [Candidatus Aminicenantes bacterium]|nr:hydrogenase expression/formation protein HypE [Candidatus Aminicenantes bacterium]